MTSPEADAAVPTKRPMRADARRNYDKLIAAARDAFTEQGAAASLEDIARRAGVGIGTLYRHFPTRHDLLEAVYVDEVEALSRSATDALVAVTQAALARAWTRRAAIRTSTVGASIATTEATRATDAPTIIGR